MIVTYDDSDGWCDHAYASPIRASFDAVGQLNGNGKCGAGKASAGVNGSPVNGRCGPGVRIPFVVLSPYAKQNYVDHTMLDQSSVVRFIEDNWFGGQRIGGGSFDATAGDLRGLFDFTSKPNTTPLYLDPMRGTALSSVPMN